MVGAVAERVHRAREVGAHGAQNAVRISNTVICQTISEEQHGCDGVCISNKDQRSSSITLVERTLHGL